MFSVEQKRDISNSVQQILRDIGHPELPTCEISFMLHVAGRYSWSWADIQNNGAVLNPSVNPHNEAQAETTPAQPDPKPLAQYLTGYIGKAVVAEPNFWRGLIEQALDAYESTENVTVKIERSG